MQVDSHAEEMGSLCVKQLPDSAMALVGLQIVTSIISPVWLPKNAHQSMEHPWAYL